MVWPKVHAVSVIAEKLLLFAWVSQRLLYPVRISPFLAFCVSSLLRRNHSTLQRGMLHTAAEGGTATEGDRGGEGLGLVSLSSLNVVCIH